MLNLAKRSLIFNKKQFNIGFNLNNKNEIKNLFSIFTNKFYFAENRAASKKAASTSNPTTSTQIPGIPDFKPIEEMSHVEFADKLRDSRKETYYYYGSDKKNLQSKIFSKTEFAAKRMRQMWIASGDYNSHKHVIPMKRMRTKDDGLFKLIKQGEIAAVIEGREEFPDLNFILDKTHIKHFDGMAHSSVKPFYLKNGSDEIRCTLIKKERLPVKNTPIKVRFQRYIVGRPNLLTLNIKFIGRHLNPLLRDMDVEFAQYYHNVDVWCVTEDYPPLLEIDVRHVTPDKAFKFLELSLMLPEGMWLHRKYDSVMYSAIASMGENFNMFLSSTLYPADDPDNVGEAGGDDVELTGEVKEMNDFMEKTQGHQEKKKKKFSMPFTAASSKKLMQAKNEGADQKALKKLMTKTGTDKKTPGKKK